MNESPAINSQSPPSAKQLADALIAGEFIPFYQPLWNIQHQHWEGVETLIRWQHPSLGCIQPDAFIPAAEQSGLILDLGTYVLRTACQQMAYWHQHGLADGIVAVNVSALQINQADFVEQVVTILHDTKLPATALELELTETLALEDTPVLIKNLNHCHDLGIRLSIDDFGTGSSSLARLQCCPVTRIKIDQSFVNRMTSDPKDYAIVNSIISLAHSLHLSVLAEGVETAEQQLQLEQLGCDVLQGYRLAKPADAQSIGMLWSNHKCLESTETGSC